MTNKNTRSYTSTAVGTAPPSVTRYGGLKMLIIEHESSKPGVFDRSFSAHFNPTQISTNTSVDWKPTSSIVPTGEPADIDPPTEPQPTTLSLELFFDTSLRASPDAGLPTASAGLLSTARDLIGESGPPSGTNVLELTSKVFALTQVVEDLHRPPLCRLWWGGSFLLCGALTSLNQTFLRFLPDGTPIQAKLACSFTEQADPAAPRASLKSPDVLRIHRVSRGDTLTRLAAHYYDDPTAWRTIARANAITSPRELTPGRNILIPKLR